MSSMKERLLKSDAIAPEPGEGGGDFFGEHDATVVNAELVDGNFGIQLEVEYAFDNRNVRQWIDVELDEMTEGKQKFVFWQKDAIGAKDLAFVDLADEGKVVENIIGNKVLIEVSKYKENTQVKAVKLLERNGADALDELASELSAPEQVTLEPEVPAPDIVAQAAENDIPF